MVLQSIFLNGHGLTKREELDIHRTFKENIKKYSESTGAVIPIIYTGSLPRKYTMAFSPGGIIQRHAIGNHEARIRTVRKETYDSLVKDNMLEYYSKINLVAGAAVEIVSETIKKYSETAKKSAKILAQTATTEALFFAAQNIMGMAPDLLDDSFPFIPDIVVGTIPFYSAQRLERGMSDRILKYRAIGDIFLAHQRGSTDTLRVDITLFGPYRNFYLLYLLSLQQKGEGQLKNLESLTTSVTAPVAPLPTDVIKIPKSGKIQYESHTTYPLITQTSIMLDMFLQTLEWGQTKDTGGSTIIKVTLLFRKHIDPLGYTVFKETDKVGYLNYGDLQSERRRKELLLDTIWKMARIGKETLKVGLFGGSNMFSIDRQAVAEDPYITSISSLVGGYSYDINNAGAIFELI